jgi:hypothetical protein
MTARVSTTRQTDRRGRQRAAPATGLRRVSRVNGYDFNTGAFCLVPKDSQELRPTCVLRRLGKVQGANHAFDVQTFMGDNPVAAYQIKRGLVVKVLALVSNVSVNTGKSRDRFAPVLASLFLASNRPLRTAQFGLRLPVQFWGVNGFAVTGNEERFQAEVNANRRIIRMFRRHFSEVAHENNVPASGVTLKRRRFYNPLHRPVQFEFDVADVLKVGFSCLVKFRSVAYRELHAVKATKTIVILRVVSFQAKSSAIRWFRQNRT